MFVLYLLIYFTRFSTCGFGNALAFAEIQEQDIDFVQTDIQNRWIDAFENRQSNENDDRLVDFFGKNYVGRSVQFQFERGERVMIKQLVAHVKYVIETEGYDRFKYKVSKSSKEKNKGRSRIQEKKDSRPLKKGNTDTLDIENTHDANNLIDGTFGMELKELLFDRVRSCLGQYSVNVSLLETMDDNIVDVFKKGAKIYGRIFCIVCRENNAKEEPKQVSYYESERSSYWVLSNFIEHLKKHGLCQKEGAKRKRRKLQNMPPSIENKLSIELVPVVDNEDSVVIVDDEDSTNDIASNDTHSPQLYNQLADQITEIVTESLSNGDAQEQMSFNLKTQVANLTVTKIDPDGNCLFGSLVHQIRKLPVNSIEHQNATAELRKEVYDHILKPENFESYKRTIKGYLLNTKAENKLDDITMECTTYVKNVLAQNGRWAGAEAIGAVSDIHKVNVIVFVEDDICYMHSYNKTYGTTIAVAYRKGTNENGEWEYNHYESVSDMDADTIYNVTNFLAKSNK